MTANPAVASSPEERLLQIEQHLLSLLDEVHELWEELAGDEAAKPNRADHDDNPSS